MLSGLLLFSGALLVIALAFYSALMFFYGPYLNNQLVALQNKVATADQSIASGDEAQLIAFYSQVINVQSLLATHTSFSSFLVWLQANTEANVYYSQFSFTGGNQLAVTGFAVSEADVNQQVAIFESSPAVESVTISNVGVVNGSNQWTFSASLTLNPSFFTAVSATTTTP